MIKIKPKLLSLLKERGISQQEFSNMCGVPQGTISRFDKSSRHEARHLFAYSKALEISIEELFCVVEDD